MIKALTFSILFISSLSFASIATQSETNTNSNTRLIENLLNGFDFTIDEALVTNTVSQDLNTSLFINVQLVLTNALGEQTKINLYKSDDIINKKEGLLTLNKEVFVSGSEMFKLLDPNIDAINEATNLSIAVTLNQNTRDTILGRNLSQNEESENNPSLYQVNLNSVALVDDYGFKQNIDLPDSFSHEDNAEITDLGFAIYFR